MDAYRIGLRLSAEDGSDFNPAQVVPVFHQWIQRQALAGHLLIDVADYLHVVDGPGIVLVSHEAHVSVDRRHGRPGLAYNRKRPFAAGTDFAGRLRAVLTSTTQAANLLTDDLPALRFRTDRLVLRIDDRLHAPNDPATLARVEPDLRRVFEASFG